MKYVFYYGIKSIDESYKKEIIGPSSEDPRVLEELFELYKSFYQLCNKIKEPTQQKPNPNIAAPKNMWVTEGYNPKDVPDEKR
jgi:hypothetical protein